MIFQKFSKRQNLVLTWWGRPEFEHYDGVIADGSIRSGKTISMAIGFLLWSMSRFSGQAFGICGKTIESLRRNVIVHLPQWVEGIFDIKEYRAENKLVITNQDGTSNVYYMFGGRDESSYQIVQGVTLAGVYFDEVALMPRTFVEQAMGRCSVAGSKFWFNCNPGAPSHWFYLEWIKAARSHNMLYLHFTMDDNLSLDSKIKQRYHTMYAHSRVFYSRYILGLWVRAEGLVYPMFDREKHVVDWEPHSGCRYYAAIDYGTVNPFAVGVYEYDPVRRTATMCKELYWQGGSDQRVDNEAYYRMLHNTLAGFPIEYIVIDPSASSFIETIQKYGEYLVVKANNDVINGIQDVTKFLNAGALLFDRSCKKTFEEFDAYVWDDKSAVDAVIKEYDHSMDQLRYFCRTVLRNELKFIL